MPVDDRTSVVLAETIGSYASLLAAGSGYAVVGVEVSASHLRAIGEGSVWKKIKFIKIKNQWYVTQS